MCEATPSESTTSGAELHALLVRRARATDPRCPGEVMNLAAAVILHGLVERAAGAARAPSVANELGERFAAEHASLCEALSLMEELAADPDEADDLRALCAEVHQKLLRHVERDERVIYGSLARLTAIAPPEDDE